MAVQNAIGERNFKFEVSKSQKSQPYILVRENF